MTQQLLVALSLMIMALAGIGLIGALVMSLDSTQVFSSAEQRTVDARGLKTMWAANLIGLIVGAAFWFLFTHFSPSVAARWIAGFFLALDPLTKLARHFKRKNVPSH